ncbi:MAG: glycosyltransferase, partial [Oscillospiraceae bacterium]|nr:glycosyltransferase [Oscillospiraceae bacterium]
MHNYCPRVDESIIHFDYLALKNQCFEDYRADFEAKGGQLFCLNIQSDGIKRALAVAKKLKHFLQEHHYDAVHINIGSFFPVLCCAFAAKKAGVKQIITHSHSAGIYSAKKRFFANLFKPLLPHYATDLCACSELAALNLYPEKMVREGKVRIIRNAVDAERFRYNPEQRQQIRAQLGLGSELVVGHVGRFVEVKNHKYLLGVFRELKKSVPDAKLLLVGDGELLPKMQKTADEMGIADSVIFAGRQMNVPLYYQAMDLFILPSTVEG